MIETFTAGKGVSLMVWACFSGIHGRSELVITERDLNSKKQGYLSDSYLKILDEALPTI